MIDPILLLKVASVICWIELPFWWFMLMTLKKNKSKNKPINPKGVKIQKAVVIMKKITTVSIGLLSGLIVLEFLVINPEKISFIKSGCLTGVLIPLYIFLKIFEKIIGVMNNKRGG